MNESGELDKDLMASLLRRIESARRDEVMSLDELRESLGLDKEDSEEK